MNLAFRALKVYLRLAIVAILVAGVALVFYMNRANEVRFWFFWVRDESQPVNVVWLMIGTGAGAVAGCWTLVLAWRVFRDWRELSRLREVEAREKVYRTREAELDARERRLEEAAGRPTDADGPDDADSPDGTDGEEEKSDDPGETPGEGAHDGNENATN